MRIREEVLTSATPGRVWELLADVSLHGAWNSHIVSTETFSGDFATVGLRYRITYEMSGKSSAFDAEITECVPGERLVARLEERCKGDGRHASRFMIETYTITPRGDRTHVRHDVVIHHSGIPLPIRALAWFIMKFGKPQGETFMERFAAIAEERSTKIAGR